MKQIFFALYAFFQHFFMKDCPACYGFGEVTEDQIEWDKIKRKCPTCRGMGVVWKK